MVKQNLGHFVHCMCYTSYYMCVHFAFACLPQNFVVLL